MKEKAIKSKTNENTCTKFERDILNILAEILKEDFEDIEVFINKVFSNKELSMKLLCKIESFETIYPWFFVDFILGIKSKYPENEYVKAFFDIMYSDAKRYQLCFESLLDKDDTVLDEYIARYGKYPTQIIAKHFKISLPDKFVNHMISNQNRKQVIEFMEGYEKYSGTSIVMACNYDCRLLLVTEYFDFLLERVRYYDGRKAYETEFVKNFGFSKEEAIEYGFGEECMQISEYIKFFEKFMKDGKNMFGQETYYECMKSFAGKKLVQRMGFLLWIHAAWVYCI